MGLAPCKRAQSKQAATEEKFSENSTQILVQQTFSTSRSFCPETADRFHGMACQHNSVFLLLDPHQPLDEPLHWSRHANEEKEPLVYGVARR